MGLIQITTLDAFYPIVLEWLSGAKDYCRKALFTFLQMA